MKLTIRNYIKWPTIENNLTSIEDLVFAFQIGFIKDEILNNGKTITSIKSHTFCFHYFLDNDNGDKNISFNILSVNEQTDSYCFWINDKTPYKLNPRFKKLKIENSDMNIPIQSNSLIDNTAITF